MARVTRKRDVLQAHVEAAASKGMPISRYAAAHGLSAHSLYAARRRMRAGTFVRVQPTARPVATPSTLQVRLPNGITVACAIEASGLAGFLRTLTAL
jgi:hypothetical protein